MHDEALSEMALHVPCADLTHAFFDFAPSCELVIDPQCIHADVVVMLAGRTQGTNPNETTDRAQLGKDNADLFEQYAIALASSPDLTFLIVESNPVELGVEIFYKILFRHRVTGVGVW